MRYRSIGLVFLIPKLRHLLIGGESSSNTTEQASLFLRSAGATDVISFSCTGY